MKDVLWLVQNMLRILFKSKKSVLLTLGLPIVGIIISLLMYGGTGTTNLHVGIVNHDSSRITTDTIKFINGLSHVDTKTVSPRTAKDEVAEGTLDCVITFDKGFTKSVESGIPDHIQIASIKGATVTGFVKSYLNNYLENIASFSKVANGHIDTYNQLYKTYQQSHFKVKTGTLKDTSKNKEMTYQTIGYLMMFMLYSAINLSGMITREKEGRTYFRLLSTPINSRKYVLANILTNLCVMILQIIIVIVVMTNVFHIHVSVPYWEIFVTLLLFALIAIGLSLAVVAFASSTSSMGAIENLIVAPTSMLSGCFFPIDVMPETIKKIAHFLPQSWLLDTINKLQEGQHFTGLYLNVLILLAFALAFFLIAAYKFSRNNQVSTFL
ncbi:transport permease protein [Pullulanibacillus camelliae]|uniref:Transport permease protein n=1 Tax=Pullulanibacillus camelliae TaxID=1707096 RepID=A0A8J2VKH2_9BACL|nr:ABC transporter permease [Pullulanibacillus camelliae]GGE34575.1 transport permease protein [Pullulanibacillus camelliae]